MKRQEVRERMGLDILGPFPLTSGECHNAIKHRLLWYALIDHRYSKMLCTFKHTQSELI